MKKILLDTNAYSAYLTGDEKVFNEIISADVIFLSIFVLTELLTGFKGGKKETQNQEYLYQFISKPGVVLLNATIDTSHFFAEIKNYLKKNGSPLPINDIWIASHTLETDSLLITYDNHFKYIPQIKCWNILS